MKLLSLPKTIQEAVDKCPLIIGVGPNAWARIISAYYFPKFKIVTYNDSLDNDIIEKSGVEIFSLKRHDPDMEFSPETPGRIIDHDIAREYLSKIKEDFYFLVYKSSDYLEKVCSESNWKFIGNSKALMNEFENKKRFKEIIRELGLRAIPGENVEVDSINEKTFVEFQEKLGSKKLVFQFAEVVVGGGYGTLYVDGLVQLPNYFEKLKKLREEFDKEEVVIRTVNVAPFIKGISSSISCCATHKGTLHGPIQTQMIDIPDVGAVIQGRSGSYVGTDWSYLHHSETEEKQAGHIAEKFGEYIYKKGYKGIFGLDLIVTKEGVVYPVECNPRDTDAFPLISMNMMEQGAVPLDVFHNLEHIIGEAYDFDLDEVNASYRKKYNSSQIIIYSKGDIGAVSRNVMKAGVYAYRNNDLEFVKDGFSLMDMQEGEYLITENVPRDTNKVLTEHGRMFRLIRKGGMLTSESALIPEVSEVIKLIYKKIDLVDVYLGEVNLGDVTLLTVRKKVVAKRKIKEGVVDIVSYPGKRNDGFVKPNKIKWRMDLDNKRPAIDHISSKRARKQINADTKKIEKLGIDIKIYRELTEKVYSLWFSYFKKRMSEKGITGYRVHEKWLSEKKREGKRVGAVIAYKNNEIIGGEVFLRLKDSLSVGYGVANIVDGLAGGLTLLLDYRFIEYGLREGYKTVSLGQDTNLYGLDLGNGLREYKEKLGFKPYKASKTYDETLYFVSDRLKDKTISFYAYTDKPDLSLVVLGNGEGQIPIKDVIKKDYASFELEH